MENSASERLRKGEVYKFEMRGHKIALDVRRSLFFRLDEVADEILSLPDGLSSDETVAKLEGRYNRQLILDALGELKEVGIIFSGEVEEQPFSPPEHTEITSLSLHVSHDCNLRCRYCYGDNGVYGGERMYMDGEVAFKAVDFLLRESGEQKKCNLIFFGGEPMLNLKLMKEVVEYGKRKGEETGKEIGFSVTTNGTILGDDVIDYLNREKMTALISIDGPKEIQDLQRPFASGAGSYNRIVPQLKAFLRSRERKVGARVTITPHSLCFLDTVTHLVDLGFLGVSIAMASGPAGEWTITEEHLPAIEEEYERATDYFLEKISQKQYFRFGNLTDPMRLTYFAQQRHYGCGVGRTYVAVTPTGEIFPCHRFAGMKDLSMGNLFNGLNQSWRRRFLKNHVENRESCRTCWARYLCGGGCAYYSISEGKDIAQPSYLFCRVRKRLLELAMFIHSEISLKDRSIIEELYSTVRRPYMEEESTVKKK